jgi:hypothetical protein
LKLIGKDAKMISSFLKRAWLCAVAVAAVALANQADRQAVAAEADLSVPAGCNPKSPCAGSTCQASIGKSSTATPPDACPRFGENQFDVDVFSWNSFIALNWPADAAHCVADPNKTILSGSGPVVWETYAEASDVFVAPPEQPAKWCAPATAALEKKLAFLPQDSRAMAMQQGVTKVFHQLGKVPQKLPGISEAFDKGPLTDQNGRFVRFEKRLNEDEYNYLTSSNLWSAAGQKKFSSSVSFPVGPKSKCGKAPCGPLGAIEIKAAWKVLSAAEIAGKRFYTTLAWVFNDENGSPSPAPNPVTVGLVGLHIIHKTESEPKWFWSTFEQVDNVLRANDAGPWFFNPNCKPDKCPPNVQTAKSPYVELSPKGTPANAPVQVTRQIAIQADKKLNEYYRGLLAGSVWSNYQLVSTQWATGGAPQGTPRFVANTTLETFFGPQSSCFGCHSSAQTTMGRPADFSFLLLGAQ